MYWKVSLPGDPIPIKVKNFDLDDPVPENSDIRAGVAGMQNGRAGGFGGIRAEHIKIWLRSISENEGTKGREAETSGVYSSN